MEAMTDKPPNEVESRFYRDMWLAQRAENEQYRARLGEMPVSDEASEGIVALRAENEALRERVTEAENRQGLAEIENTRLREALEKIAEQSRVEKSHDWIAQTARAALQDGPGTATYNQRWKSKP
jgi:hypothetical protein